MHARTQVKLPMALKVVHRLTQLAATPEGENYIQRVRSKLTGKETPKELDDITFNVAHTMLKQVPPRMPCYDTSCQHCVVPLLCTGNYCMAALRCATLLACGHGLVPRFVRVPVTRIFVFCAAVGGQRPGRRFGPEVNRPRS